MIDIAKLSAKENILIYAGSGGVGTIAIQLSKYLGANVTTTTSTNNVDMVKNLGADKVIDYTKQSFLDVNEKFDVVYDTLGGQHTVDSFKVLKENGRVVSIAGDLDDITAEQLGLNKFIDYDTMYQKGFIDPLKGILDVIGWKTEKQATLFDFFT